MSGGAWDYREHRLREQAEEMKQIMEAVAETEHVVDWAVSGDTSVEDAGAKLVNLWRETFEGLFG